MWKTKAVDEHQPLTWSWRVRAVHRDVSKPPAATTSLVIQPMPKNVMAMDRCYDAMLKRSAPSPSRFLASRRNIAPSPSRLVQNVMVLLGHRTVPVSTTWRRVESTGRRSIVKAGRRSDVTVSRRGVGGRRPTRPWTRAGTAGPAWWSPDTDVGRSLSRGCCRSSWSTQH